MRDPELRQHVCRTLDRTGDQLRKEAHILGIGDKVALSGNPAIVHVERIADRLKRVERNAQREHQAEGIIRHHIPEQPDHAEHVRNQEVQIFDRSEYAQVDRQRDDQRRLASAIGPSPRHHECGRVIHDRRQSEQESKGRAPAHVEYVAGDQQHQRLGSPRQREEHHQERYEERQKFERVEEHQSNAPVAFSNLARSAV
ncbi:hypothetical protein ACVWXQ_008886 [Bradyrhizobium sp. S3.14.4]